MDLHCVGRADLYAELTGDTLIFMEDDLAAGRIDFKSISRADRHAHPTVSAFGTVADNILA